MFRGLRSLFGLIRIKQVLFKNSIILISLVFSFGKFPLSSLFKNIFFIFLGFISLAFVSASSYIINDIIDYEKDKKHPEKRHRAIASGEISKKRSFVIAAFLLLFSLNTAAVLSIFSSWIFFFLILGLFLISQSYSLYFRNIIFLDIIIISINFVIRAISGVFIIEGGDISYWIILCTFFLSLFLVGSKRIAEIKLKEIKSYRNNYEDVDETSLLVIVLMSISSVILFFCVYSVLYKKPLLLISLPISLYITLLYFNSVYKEPKKIRNPEEFIFSKKIVSLLVLWILLIILALVF